MPTQLCVFLASVSLLYPHRRDDEDGDLECAEAGNASYSRYSSEAQDERSIGDQQRKCRDRAARYEDAPSYAGNEVNIGVSRINV